MRDEREARGRFLLGRLLADTSKEECAAELLRDAVYYMPDMVAAHVELGFAYCQLERYEEMLGALREAIRLDARAVRAAVRDDPEELDSIWMILYPEQPAPPPTGTRRESAIPAYVRQSWALVAFGREQIGAEHDSKAVAALENVLKLDKTYMEAAVLLSLAYLLSREGGGIALSEVKGSVLWKVEPSLAELLFKG
jgi:tetratricopeptide (TPR) repeat protein